MVILLAGSTFLHINTLARTAGLTRSKWDDRRMRELCWLGQRSHLYWDIVWSFTQDRFFPFKVLWLTPFLFLASPPPSKKYSKVIKGLNQNIERAIAERGFDPRTSGLWAQHASTAPLCYLRSREVIPTCITRSRHCLCKAGVDRKWRDSFNSFAPRLKNIASTKKEFFSFASEFCKFVYIV